MATWSAGLDTLLHDASLVYLGLFLAALIDATGFPFPGRALLVAAGAATAEDWGHVALMTAAGALGAVVGDHLWYAAGRLGAGDRLTRLLHALARLRTLRGARPLPLRPFRAVGHRDRAVR